MMHAQLWEVRLEYMYALALRLYPKSFRHSHAAEMRQAFRDALRDPALSRRALISLVLRDLATSLVKEHLAMLAETFSRPALLFNALVLGGLATGLALALYAIPQQVLRQGLNDPQIAIATDLVTTLERGGQVKMPQYGEVPGIESGSTDVDMARSLSPFFIVYDDRGNVVASQALLNGQTPTPPSGVFDFVRQHGEDRISWQPQRGVRIAAVIQRVSGTNPGFVLAGRNMREVEARENQVFQMAALTWLVMLGVILAGVVSIGWYARPKPA